MIKFILILFSILIVKINSFKTPDSELYISLQQYEYQGDCSSLDSTSDSSYYIEKCYQQDLIGGYLIKQNVCINFNDQPSIFTLTENNGTVLQSIYSDTDEFCKGNPISKRETDLNFCFYGCENYYGLTYQMSLIQDIDVPSSTLVDIEYTGECNGEFKHSSILINYSVLNKCNVRYSVDSLSSIVTCNQTTATATAYSDFQCQTQVLSQSNLLNNICGRAEYPNILQICNL